MIVARSVARRRPRRPSPICLIGVERFEAAALMAGWRPPLEDSPGDEPVLNHRR